MFANSCEKMMKCTYPLISSIHCINGRVESSLGAFVVINSDGWAFTAGHCMLSMMRHRESLKSIQDVKEWNSSHPDEPKEMDGDWVDYQSFWFGITGVEMDNVYINMELDLALFKFKNFRREYVKEYPTFADPNKIRPGTSVCRLGFPFADATTYFDDTNEVFRMKEGVLPIPFFPNDGIYTRTLNSGKTSDSNLFDKLFIETSTPGLRGQSGGPIFNKEGHIVAIQTRTIHIPLGFKTNLSNGEEIPEQVMNLGVGVHIKTLMDIMDWKGVKYKSVVNDDGYRIIG